MPRRGWTIALLLAAGLAARVAAQPLPPSPPLPPEAPAGASAGMPPAPSHPAHLSLLGDPVPVLGEPIESGRRDLPPDTRPRGDSPRDPMARRETYAHPIVPVAAAVPYERPAEPQARTATIGRPVVEEGEEAPSSLPAKRAEGTGHRADKAPAKSGDDPVGELLTRRTVDRTREREIDGEKERGRSKGSSHFGSKIVEAADGLLGPQHDRFRSDHAFDCYISPVTNSFLFEDPRSLTEVRPIFMYQHIPSNQPDFHGGNVNFFGVQARLAITERFSLVIHKLGGVSLNPGSGAPLPGGTGFAELWLGPKYTFIRDETTGTLAAGGLQFQLPVGNSSVYQHTGSLSLVPYISVAHPFFRESRIGALNTMLGTGYSFSTNRARSDYYYLSAHADVNAGNWNHVFPLAELNWFLNTTNATARPIGVEGRDLINFGGQAKGQGLLTGALGARFKITEPAQIGFAYEVPLAGPRDLFRYRFTLDFILRY